VSWLTSILRRVGVLSAFTADDVLNAESEDALREHKLVVEEVKTQSAARKQTNEKLRNALRQARVRTHAFAEFEQGIQGESRNHVRRRNK